MYIELHNERVTHYSAAEDLRCLLAGPDGPDVTTPPRSKYFLPGELSHSLLVSTTGGMWLLLHPGLLGIHRFDSWQGK